MLPAPLTSPSKDSKALRASCPHPIQTHLRTQKPCGQAARAPFTNPSKDSKALRARCPHPLPAPAGKLPAPFTNPSKNSKALRASCPHPLQTHLRTQQPCGHAARAFCKAHGKFILRPPAPLTSSPWDSKGFKKPCKQAAGAPYKPILGLAPSLTSSWDSKALRGRCLHPLQAHLGTQKPCGQAARTRCKRNLELKRPARNFHPLQAHLASQNPAGKLQAPLTSTFWDSKALWVSCLCCKDAYLCI